MYRKLVTSLYGTPITKNDVQREKGRVYRKIIYIPYSELNSTWDKNNFSLVAFAHKMNTSKEVLQAEIADIQ